ncbi:MAG: DUF424 family protein [archaeon]
MKILIAVHDLYRKVIAVCDTELIGKTFEEGELNLEVKENFYKGKEFEEKKAIEFLQDLTKEDACFNIVGKNSISICEKAGIIAKNNCLTIQGIPHAMALL